MNRKQPVKQPSLTCSLVKHENGSVFVMGDNEYNNLVLEMIEHKTSLLLSNEYFPIWKEQTKHKNIKSALSIF